MTSINKLSALDTLSAGDQLAIWAPNNGDTRRGSIGLLTNYITGQLSLPIGIERSQYAAPSTSPFIVSILFSNTWLILNPTGTLAAGTIVMPTAPADLTLVAIVTTQTITSLTVNGGGPTVVGAPSTLAAGQAFTMRFDAATNSWYLDNNSIVNISTYAQTLLDDPDAATARTTLGLGTIATQAANAVAITGGSVTGITDLAIADGGTGASDAAGARTNLGLGTIATQAASAVAITGGSITGITDLAVADGGTGASDAAGARTNLGLGTIATQAASSVSITGGSITGITDIAVADGGTGASTAAQARINLDLEIGVDVQAYDADLAAVAGLASNGMIARTGAGTAAVRTITAGTGISVANGNGVSGNPTIAATSILENVAATDIAAIANAINTTGKAAGRMIWDTTNTKIKVATGSAAADTWVDADGTNAVTPS